MGLALFLLLHFLPQSDEKKIRTMLEEMRTLAEVREKEPVFEGLGKARKLSRFLASNFSAALPEGKNISFRDQREFQQKIAAGRAELSSLEISLKNITVEVEAKKARLQFTITALGAMLGAEGQFLEIHTVALELVKTEQGWLIEKGIHLRNEREEKGS